MDLTIGYSISTTIQNVKSFVAVTTGDYIYGKQYHRWQIPLEPAFASTTHKVQGTTAMFGAVIDPSEKKPFALGLDYVAASRPTELVNFLLHLKDATSVHFRKKDAI